MKQKKFIFVSLIILFLMFFYSYILNQRKKNDVGKVGEPTVQLEISATSSHSSSSDLLNVEQLQAGIESNRLMRAQAEERAQQALIAEENERLRLAHWKAHFPYKKTYHPTLTFDPSRYDPNASGPTWDDPEMVQAVMDHGFLVAFYNNPQIYSAEFEQLYHMLTEIDRADHPKITGKIFNNLITFYKLQKFDQDALWSKRVTLPLADPSGSTKEMVEVRMPIDGKTTWGDMANSYHASIVGLLVKQKHWPDRALLDADVARAFRDRLFDEIPSENLVKMRDVVELPNGEIGAFGYYDDAEKALKPGDKLLYR